MANVKTFSKKTHGNLNIAPNFKVREFACHDGTDKVLIDFELVSLLQLIRNIKNAPVEINSGYRTTSWNKKQGGASNSYHLYGRAFDISCGDARELCTIANSIGIKGIILYNSFIHIDTRESEYHDNYSNFSYSFSKIDIPYQNRLMAEGMNDWLIGCIQFKLKQKGYDCGTVDWIFGPKTLAKVKRFQEVNGLKVDGIVGCQTWNRLFNNY